MDNFTTTDLARISAEDIPFSIVLKENELRSYFSCRADDIEEEYLTSSNSSKIQSIIIEAYEKNNPFEKDNYKWFFSNLVESVDEMQYEGVYQIADIEQCFRCASCEKREKCWDRDFSFNEFMMKRGMTPEGSGLYEDCSDLTVSEWFDYYSYNCYLDSSQREILECIAELGYSVPLDEYTASEFFNNSHEAIIVLARRMPIFNDCQRTLVEGFEDDFYGLGEPYMPLMLGGGA